MNVLLEKKALTCWHKYCLWCKGFSSSLNFLLKIDTFQRKRFVEIAVGKCLENSFCESLHLKKNGTYEEETGPTDSVRIQGFNELESKNDELEGKTNGASHDSLKTKNSISL